MGPESSESSAANPFFNYRMDVFFTSPSGRTYKVPGFFAADGEAAQTGATEGRVWRALFSPGELGQWRYRVAFREGERIAISSETGKSAGYFDQSEGHFSVTAPSKVLSDKDFRKQGKLRYVNKHYLQFAGSRDYFLKAGANSPEVFLGYQGFDATPSDRAYPVHIKDWQVGDPLWHATKGKGIILKTAVKNKV